jgi:elongation factor G
MSEANFQDRPARPVLSVAVRPRSKEDGARFVEALRDLSADDPMIPVSVEGVDGEAIIRGMNEPHLESICARIVQEYKVPLAVGELQIIYLETVRRCAEGEDRYIRQAGGLGNYGHVKVRVEPNEVGAGFDFVDEIKDGTVPRQYIEAAEQGIREALRGGVLAGYEVVDLKATLFDGSYHAVDSNEMAFRIAGAMAFKEAARRAGPVLLEPVMAVAVVTPEEYMGVVIGDLNARRGRIQGVEQGAGSRVIKANVPLSEMLGYGRSMRLQAQGTLEYSMQFLRYEEAPRPRDGWGEDGAGVTADRPKPPRAGSGSAVAMPDEDFD